MDNPIYTEDYKGLKISIYQDNDAQSPEDWGDDSLFLVAFHRDFTIKHEGFSQDVCREIVDMDANEAERAKEIKKDYWHFGLEAYIHSGVTLALSSEGNFPDRQWDVSQLGLVFVKKTEAKTKEGARKMALGLIASWNDALSGNVYGFIISDELDDNLESVWGFYGDYDAKGGVLDEARGIADSLASDRKKLRDRAKKEDALGYNKTLRELLASDDPQIVRLAKGIKSELSK